MSLLSLPSCKLSGEIEIRKLANTGKFALFVHLQASSEILWMLISALKTQFYNNTQFPFKARNIFISAVNLKS